MAPCAGRPAALDADACGTVATSPLCFAGSQRCVEGLYSYSTAGLARFALTSSPVSSGRDVAGEAAFEKVGAAGSGFSGAEAAFEKEGARGCAADAEGGCASGARAGGPAVGAPGAAASGGCSAARSSSMSALKAAPSSSSSSSSSSAIAPPADQAAHQPASALSAPAARGAHRGQRQWKPHLAKSCWRKSPRSRSSLSSRSAVAAVRTLSRKAACFAPSL
mmetsp:Transcript_93253/g.295804  ORF Transcript_93253/g.295804 Transcript_93253/m.295804 type:complete len:221 (-) Transcript_93253:329-991(-)